MIGWFRGLLEDVRAWYIETLEETDEGASEEQLRWLDDYYARRKP